MIHHDTVETYPGLSSMKVLVYHRIVQDERPGQFSVCERDFIQHLELLDRWGFTAITFDELRLCLQGDLNLPRKPVIITFDDGYTDNFEFAYPALVKYGMKAVFFVQGDRLLRRSEWDEREGLPGAELMTDEQLLELHTAGCEIGSHTLTHPRLTTLGSVEAWEQISDSRMKLEILINASVRSFAYPYGLHNDEIRKLVADAGYTVACAVGSGSPKFFTDPLLIRRVAIPGTTTPLGFALRVLTPFQYFEWTKSWIKGVIRKPLKRSLKNISIAAHNKHGSMKSAQYDEVQS